MPSLLCTWASQTRDAVREPVYVGSTGQSPSKSLYLCIRALDSSSRCVSHAESERIPHIPYHGHDSSFPLLCSVHFGTLFQITLAVHHLNQGTVSSVLAINHCLCNNAANNHYVYWTDPASYIVQRGRCQCTGSACRSRTMCNVSALFSSIPKIPFPATSTARLYHVSPAYLDGILECTIISNTCCAWFASN